MRQIPASGILSVDVTKPSEDTTASMPEGTTQQGWWILEGVLCSVLGKMLKTHPECTTHGFYLTGSTPLEQVEKAVQIVADEYLALTDPERSEGARALIAVLECREHFGAVIFAGIQCGQLSVVFPKGHAGSNTFEHVHVHIRGVYVTGTVKEIKKKVGPQLRKFILAVCSEYKKIQETVSPAEQLSLLV